jgi:hypothetical protein
VLSGGVAQQPAPRESERSMKVGVVVPLGATPETGQVVHYADTRAFALQAAATGFDSLWLYDHLLYRAPNQPTQGIWEAWTILSALAEATTQVELGTLVLCTPFRNPAILAKMHALAYSPKRAQHSSHLFDIIQITGCVLRDPMSALVQARW